MKKKLVVIIPIAVIIIAVIGFFAWLYTGSFSPAKQKVFKKTSLPVAKVGNKFISGKEFMSRFELAQSLLKQQDGYNENEVKGQIMTQLIDNDKLITVAQAKNVSVSPEQIDTEYKVFVQNFAQGDEGKFQEMLQQTYRLSVDEFKAKVLKPDLTMTALTVWHNKQENLNQEAFNQQKAIESKLSGGAQFADVAKELSQDESTKELGGDTGFVASKDLLPEFQSELNGMKLNDQKTIISRFGIHTVKVIEVDPNDAGRYHLQQIFVKEASFEKWYAAESGKIKTRTLIKV